MKGNPKIIKLLNTALKKELTAINQYFLHARMLKDWGVTKLGEKEYRESIEEMEHADWLIERILFLGGLPNLQDLGKLRIGENVKEILEADLATEMEAHPMYRDAVTQADELHDYVSRDLFAKILSSEEEHIDFLETQLEMIENMGLQNYIQLQSHAAEAPAA
ncbi:MAG: bacterioferritin [Pseudomonadota bacterium]